MICRIYARNAGKWQIEWADGEHSKMLDSRESAIKVAKLARYVQLGIGASKEDISLEQAQAIAKEAATATI